MSYRDLIEQEREELIGRKVKYKGEPFTVVGVDYNGGVLINKKAEFTDSTAVSRFDPDLEFLDDPVPLTFLGIKPHPVG